MKIALDHQTFTLQTYGGISRYFTRLAEEVHHLGHEVRIFAGLHRNGYLNRLPPSLVTGRGLSSYPKRTAKLFFAANHFFGHLNTITWRPDVLHETFYCRVRTGRGRQLRAITVFDLIDELGFVSHTHSAESYRRKAHALSRADLVISISHSTKRDLVRMFGMPEEKVSVVHLGVDLPPRSSSIACSVLPETKPILLYVGKREGYKNFSALLRALSSSRSLMHGVELVAFGGGAFSSSELLEQKQLGFASGQVRHAAGSDDELRRLYSNAAALVYPSLYEGFGLPPLEAMAHGCAVIASNTSSMPEVLGDAAAFFDPADTDQLRDQIEAVVSRSDVRSTLVAAGLQRCLQFTWRKCAEETVRVYESSRQQ